MVLFYLEFGVAFILGGFACGDGGLRLFRPHCAHGQLVVRRQVSASLSSQLFVPLDDAVRGLVLRDLLVVACGLVSAHLSSDYV